MWFRVVYDLHEKTIWLETVQMERKIFSWKISFEVCAFHLQEAPEAVKTNYKFDWN